MGGVEKSRIRSGCHQARLICKRLRLTFPVKLFLGSPAAHLQKVWSKRWNFAKRQNSWFSFRKAFLCRLIEGAKEKVWSVPFVGFMYKQKSLAIRMPPAFSTKPFQ